MEVEFAVGVAEQGHLFPAGVRPDSNIRTRTRDDIPLKLLVVPRIRAPVHVHTNTSPNHFYPARTSGIVESREATGVHSDSAMTSMSGRVAAKREEFTSGPRRGRRRVCYYVITINTFYPPLIPPPGVWP